MQVLEVTTSKNEAEKKKKNLFHYSKIFDREQETTFETCFFNS